MSFFPEKNYVNAITDYVTVVGVRLHSCVRGVNGTLLRTVSERVDQKIRGKKRLHYRVPNCAEARKGLKATRFSIRRWVGSPQHISAVTIQIGKLASVIMILDLLIRLQPLVVKL